MFDGSCLLGATGGTQVTGGRGGFNMTIFFKLSNFESKAGSKSFPGLASLGGN